MKMWVALIGGFFTCTALAWDGNVTGKITSIQVTAAENYGFRISIDALVNLCGAGPLDGFGYINKSNDNYQTYVAILTAAALADKKVQVLMNRHPTTQRCEIGHITLPLGV